MFEVSFHYVGYNESGRRIDSTYLQGTPAKIRMGTNGLVTSFEEEIGDMRPGGKRRMIIPPELGPPVDSSTFFSAKQYEVFDVELMNILQIVLNDDPHGRMTMDGGMMVESDDEDGDPFVIIGDGDGLNHQGMGDTEWVEDGAQSAEGERNDTSDGTKANGGMAVPPKKSRDACDLCPQNGECYEGKLECVRGYRKHGKLCIEDGDINENAKKISEMVESRVCEAYAQYMCYGTGTVWVGEGEIMRELDELKLMEMFGMDRSKFIHSRSRAMEASVRLLDTRKNLEGMQEFKCPDVLAEHYKPFTCQTRQWISQHAFILAPVFALLVGCTFIFRKISRRIHLSRRAEELYLQICDILEEHTLMSKSAAGENEPWIVVSSLRDHLLLPRERKDPELWRKVETLVQEDSRLDRYPKLVKGESKVVWEWQVEGSLSSSRMRKTRGLIDMKPHLQMSLNNHQHQHLARCSTIDRLSGEYGA